MRSNCGPGHPSGVETELPLVYSAALAGGQTAVMMPYVKHVKSVNVMYCIPFVSFTSHLLNPLSTSCLRNRSAWLECSISCWWSSSMDYSALGSYGRPSGEAYRLPMVEWHPMLVQLCPIILQWSFSPPTFENKFGEAAAATATCAAVQPPCLSGFTSR